MAIIHLPHGNSSFNSIDLSEYLKKSNRNFIIQGQVACIRVKHPKPNSLDCWLRDNYARNPDTKQAVNSVIASLVNSGEFEEGKFVCPDSKSKRMCKGIKTVNRAK